MKVKELYNLIDAYAPFNIAMEHDNPGLLFGHEQAEVEGILITLDADMTALEKAVELNCNTILSHHPFFFEGENRITDADGYGRKILFAAEQRLNIISAHTNLDSCDNGINDTLGKCLGLTVTERFIPTQNGGYLGRIGTHGFTSPEEFLKNAAKRLNCVPRYVLPNQSFEKIAWVSGSGASCLKDAIAAGADTLVTGDCKYSAFMDARQEGINLIDLGHFETEQIIVPVLAKYLEEYYDKVYTHIIDSPILIQEEK